MISFHVFSLLFISNIFSYSFLQFSTLISTSSQRFKTNKHDLKVNSNFLFWTWSIIIFKIFAFSDSKIEFPLFTKINPSENWIRCSRTLDLKMLFAESKPGKSINSIVSFTSSGKLIRSYASIGMFKRKKALLKKSCSSSMESFVFENKGCNFCCKIINVFKRNFFV